MEEWTQNSRLESKQYLSNMFENQPHFSHSGYIQLKELDEQPVVVRKPQTRVYENPGVSETEKIQIKDQSGKMKDFSGFGI